MPSCYNFHFFDKIIIKMITFFKIHVFCMLAFSAFPFVFIFWMQRENTTWGNYWMFFFSYFFRNFWKQQLLKFQSFHWYKENHSFSALFLEGGKAPLFSLRFSIYYYDFLASNWSMLDVSSMIRKNPRPGNSFTHTEL